MEGVSFWSILKSRKFWVLILALITSASLFATQQIDGWQFLEAVIAAVAAYSTGVALEDAGAKMGAKNVLDKIPAQPLSLTTAKAEPKTKVKQGSSGISGPAPAAKEKIVYNPLPPDETQG